MSHITMKEIRAAVAEFVTGREADLRSGEYARYDYLGALSYLDFANNLGSRSFAEMARYDHGKNSGAAEFVFIDLGRFASTNNVFENSILKESNFKAITEVHYANLYAAGLLFDIEYSNVTALGLKLTGHVDRDLREYYIDFLQTARKLIEEYPILDEDIYFKIESEYLDEYLESSAGYDFSHALTRAGYDVDTWELQPGMSIHSQNTLDAYYAVAAQSAVFPEIDDTGYVDLRLNDAIIAGMAGKLGIHKTIEGNE